MPPRALVLALLVLAGAEGIDVATSIGDATRESAPRDSVLWKFDTGG